MSYEDEILVKKCFLCNLSVEVSRIIEIGGYFLCHDCAKKFFEVVRQWIRKDVFI